MNLLFLCGSAEPGKDGVGDYTRRLCGELIRTGHNAQIVSLYDKHVVSFITQNQVIEETPVIVRRMPIITSYKQRLAWTQEIVKEIAIDWISLQFVPYSFNPKGLPFWMSGFLKALKGNHQWHVMFHEIWIGIEKKASLKSKCTGILQKQIVLKILQNLNFVVINTNTNLYRLQLLNLGYNSKLLPLFSNISNNIIDYNEKKTDELIFAFFGGIHFGAPIQEFMDELKLELEKRKGCFVKFLFVGNCGSSLKEWTMILDSENIKYEIFGYCSNQEISEKLLTCNYGVSTTPYLLIQKSGSVATLIEHGLPVLCIARKWEVSKLDINKVDPMENVIDFKKDSIQKLFNKKIEKNKINTLTSVTDSLLEILNSN